MPGSEQECRVKSLSTFIFLLLSAFIERNAEQIVPALFPHIDQTFVIGPFMLGLYPFTRAIPQCCFAQLGGFCAQKYNRKFVLPLGCILFGVGLGIFCIMTTYWLGYIAMIFGGFGLCGLIPGSYSLLADTANAHWTGAAFGTFYGVGMFGVAFATFISITFSSYTVHELIGWRFVVLLVSLVAVFGGFLGLWMTRDPRMMRPGLNDYKVMAPKHRTFKQYFQQTLFCLRIPSYRWALFQGMFGLMPFNALIFLSLFLNAVGYKDAVDGLIFALFWAVAGVGGFFAGKIGDMFDRRWSCKGRIGLVQFWVLMCVALAVITFELVPRHENLPVHLTLLSLLGFCSSWATPALTLPIIKDVVPEEYRDAAFSTDRFLENLPGVIIGLLGGQMAIRFGWKDTQLHPEAGVQQKNADAMAQALLYCMACTWAGCMVIQTALYWTYPMDRLIFPDGTILEKSRRTEEREAAAANPHARHQTRFSRICGAVAHPFRRSPNTIYGTRTSNRPADGHTEMNGHNQAGNGTQTRKGPFLRLNASHIIN